MGEKYYENKKHTLEFVTNLKFFIPKSSQLWICEQYLRPEYPTFEYKKKKESKCKNTTFRIHVKEQTNLNMKCNRGQWKFESKRALHNKMKWYELKNFLLKFVIVVALWRFPTNEKEKGEGVDPISEI